MRQVLNKFFEIEVKHKTFINLIIKPLLSLIVFLSIGYYTMWLSANYVKQDQFLSAIADQTQREITQSDTLKKQFESVQSRLEVILNQQIIFSEQLKTFNTLVQTQQKQHDILYERVLYLERMSRHER